MRRLAAGLVLVVAVVAGCSESYPGEPPTDPDHGTIYAEIAVDQCGPAICGTDPVFVFFETDREAFALRDASVQAAITRALPAARFPISREGLIGEDGLVVESGRIVYLEPINMITDRRLQLVAGWDNGKTDSGRDLYRYEWDGSGWINVIGITPRSAPSPST